eukprot:1195160-Prorocentrum_minimum.AAC.10
MLRSYGEEWKRAFEQLQTSSENGMPVGMTLKRDIKEMKRPREQERIHIDTQESNPAEDLCWDQKNGPCIFIEESLAKCYTSSSKFVSSLTLDKLEDLWHRYNWASEAGLHDKLDPPM